MIAYASRTGTAKNLAFLRDNGWGLMVSAMGVHRTEGFNLYAIDNGAWAAYQQGHPFNVEAFEKVIEKFGDGAQFVVVPDVVGDGAATMQLVDYWLPRLEWVGRRRLIAVQDGMEPATVKDLLGPTVGIFVGGTTDWKLQTLPSWARLADQVGCYFHVGRVNSARRIWLCRDLGVDSFDGSGASKWLKWAQHLERARRQLGLFEERQ